MAIPEGLVTAAAEVKCTDEPPCGHCMKVSTMMLAAAFAALPEFEDRINIELPRGWYVRHGDLKALARLVDE